jgi:hypothetical protein
VDLGYRICLGLDARDDRDVFGHVLLGETVQRYTPCDGFSDELGKGRSKWIPHLRIDIAVGGKEEQSCFCHITSEEPEEKQRRFVGSVQVVEEQHDGSLPSDVLQERDDRVEQTDACPLELTRRCLG